MRPSHRPYWTRAVVQPQLGAQREVGLLVADVLAEDRDRRVAGQDVEQREGDQADDEQDRHHADEPTQDVFTHGALQDRERPPPPAPPLALAREGRRSVVGWVPFPSRARGGGGGMFAPHDSRITSETGTVRSRSATSPPWSSTNSESAAISPSSIRGCPIVVRAGVV